MSTSTKMRIYRSSKTIDIPENVSLTELIHQTPPGFSPLPDNHVIATDNLENRTLTINQLRSRAGRIAHGLVQKYQPRDQSRWAIIVPNSIAYLEAFHAVLWLGGVGCPINHLLTVGELSNAFEVARPEFVIVYGQIVEKVEEGIRKAQVSEEPRIIVVVESHFPSSSSSSSGSSRSPAQKYPTLNSFLNDSPTSLPIPHYPSTKNRLASIHLSSGTTGRSKGVGLTHYNYMANCYQMLHHDPERWHLRETIVAFTPFVHIANTTIPLFLGPWTGMRHIIMSKFDLDTYAHLIQTHRPTSIQIAGSLGLAIANTDITSRYDFGSVKYMPAGQMAMRQETYAKLLAKGRTRKQPNSQRSWKAVTLYGMTEASPFVTWSTIAQDPELGVSGSLLPNMSARLVLETGEEAPPGGPGELWLKGPNMTQGYVDNPLANKSAFKQDGWYNTGDVCTVSADGQLKVVSRTKELIKYNGFQVSPNELEGYINPFEFVEDCAVGRTFDRDKGTELPTAYVVLKNAKGLGQENRRTLLKRVHDGVDGQVSGYKNLRGGVWEVTQIPRNAQNKVVRDRLRDMKTGLCSLGEGGSVGNREAKL